MGLLSALSFSGSSPRVVTGNGPQTHSGQHLGQNRWHRATPAKERLPLHPNREWPSQEVIRHLVEFHHNFFRESLSGLADLLEQCASLATVRRRPWEAIAQRFRKLHDAFLSGMQLEESVVFPQLLDWQISASGLTPASELLDAAKTVERTHSLCLQMLWRLLRLIRDELEISPDNQEHRPFSEQLAALCDDYEQHLFEEECLLLPKLFSDGSTSNSGRRESNGSHHLDGST